MAANAPTRSGERGCKRGLEILLFEGERERAASIASSLSQEGHSVCVALDSASALSALQAATFDLIISDSSGSDVGEPEVFRWAREHAPRTSLVVARANVAEEASPGRSPDPSPHVLQAPLHPKRVLETVEQIADSASAREVSLPATEAERVIEERIVGQSPAMRALKSLLSAVAAADAPVLIHGETGTGKEVVARAIHAASPRANGPFVAINCGALPEALVEAELFGHEKGAFTGASHRRDGSFVTASGGTLFLDEVTETPPACQVKLLRALQEGIVRPVGSDRLVRTHVRLLAATNADIGQVLGSGRLREDLFYRLKVLDANLPPLRERRGDLPLLVEHFLRRFSKGRALPSLSAYAWTLLERHTFPGNVRELEHAIQHAVILSGGETIDAQHLPDDIRGAAHLSESPPTLAEAMAAFEREFLLRTLDSVGWSRTRASEQLGISRKSLWTKLKRHGISPSENGAVASEPPEPRYRRRSSGIVYVR